MREITSEYLTASYSLFLISQSEDWFQHITRAQYLLQRGKVLREAPPTSNHPFIKRLKKELPTILEQVGKFPSKNTPTWEQLATLHATSLSAYDLLCYADEADREGILASSDSAPVMDAMLIWFAEQHKLAFPWSLHWADAVTQVRTGVPYFHNNRLEISELTYHYANTIADSWDPKYNRLVWIDSELARVSLKVMFRECQQWQKAHRPWL